MSSAILYLAIVAIWAVVLVPRWLRHPHAAPQPGQVHEEEPQPASQPDLVATAAGNGAGPRARRAPVAAGSVDDPGAVPASGSHHPRAGPDRHRAPVPASLSPAAGRARILRARRRTLSALILLAASSAGLAGAHLAAWWVTIPPGVMLAGFLLLLRTAAGIDDQRAAARAHAASQRQAAAQTRQQAPAAPAAQPGDDTSQPGAAQPAAVQPGAAQAGAEIIDISARIGDQLYDQYTDARARAIGD